jgi:acyl dehydratase
MGYEMNELGEDDQTRFSFPMKGAEPDLFDYPSTESDMEVQMDQDVNEDLYRVGEDGNPIHYDTAYAEAFGDTTPFFDVPEDQTVIQGSAFVYEAIRNADDLVDHVSAQFHNPVFSDDAVRIERELLDGGEQVTVYAGEDDDAYACQIELDYDGAADLSERERERRNTANAMKPARAVGGDNQLNNLLLGVEADLGDGDWHGTLEHTAMDEVNGESAHNRIDTFTYDDGTEVTLSILETDDELGDAVVSRYREIAEQKEDYTAPSFNMWQAWTDAWCNAIEFWTER